jgi:hypothetical protein
MAKRSKSTVNRLQCGALWIARRRCSLPGGPALLILIIPVLLGAFHVDPKAFGGHSKLHGLDDPERRDAQHLTPQSCEGTPQNRVVKYLDGDALKNHPSCRYLSGRIKQEGYRGIFTGQG